MYTFYNEMKNHIIVYSNLSKKTLLTEQEIKSLKPYASASEVFRADFDDSVLGGRQMGVSKPKVKSKTFNSSFSNGYNSQEEVVQTEVTKKEEPFNFAAYYAEKTKQNIEPQKEADNATTIPEVQPQLDTTTINQPKIEPNNIVSFPKTDVQSNETPVSPYFYKPSNEDITDYLIA